MDGCVRLPTWNLRYPAALQGYFNATSLIKLREHETAETSRCSATLQRYTSGLCDARYWTTIGRQNQLGCHKSCLEGCLLESKAQCTLKKTFTLWAMNVKRNLCSQPVHTNQCSESSSNIQLFEHQHSRLGGGGGVVLCTIRYGVWNKLRFLHGREK